MATIRVRLPKELVIWCKKQFRNDMNTNFEPTESQIVTHALYQLKSNITGEEYEIP